VALLVALAFAGCGSDGADPVTSAAPTTFPHATVLATVPTRATSASPTTTRAAVASGLPTITVAQLPAEARDTLALIEAGGPFPYSQDGVVFENRERRLPQHARGWYHEYTVPTPGEDDRGARRIITGQDDERFYTPDHYESFRQVVDR
jgi:ribonuclease T1